MNNLLDTHTLIWFINGDKALSVQAKDKIEDSNAINYVSIASLWEIAIKISLGKLELRTPFTEIRNQIRVNSFQILPVSFEDTLAVSTLPFHHRDPFDRILIAQAVNNNLQILTKDAAFENYDVSIVW
jgi:PIN domain nuclease of toxin-antitoxin system